jgi:hypothetical protein
MTSKQLVPAIGAVLVAGLAYFFLLGGISTLSASDAATMLAVTNSGAPWMVLCDEAGARTAVGRTEESATFGAARKLPTFVAGGIQTGVLDCGAAMSMPGSMGKSVFALYGVDEDPAAYQHYDHKPIVLMFANGKKPAVAPPAALSSAKALTKWALAKSVAKVVNPTDTPKLEQACLSAGATATGCLIFTRNLKKGMSGKDFQTLAALAKQFRKLRVLWVNNQKHDLKAEGAKNLRAGLYIMKRLKGGEHPVPIGKKGTMVHVGLRKFDGKKMELGAVAAWAAGWEDDAGFTEMQKTPTLWPKGYDPESGTVDASGSTQDKAAARKRKRDAEAAARGKGKGGSGGGDAAATEAAAEKEAAAAVEAAAQVGGRGVEEVDGQDELSLVDDDDDE